MSGIFVIKSDGGLAELTERGYDTEAMLQSLLAQHPRLIAGDLIDPEDPRRWLLVSREVGLASEAEGNSRWAVDHLFVDQDGIPTVVEVKRSTDTRIRREVIGQIIEYAANAVVYWPVESLRARFEKRCDDEGLDSRTELSALCAREIAPDEFWKQVQTNLQAGRVRLILVSDEIPTELRRMVEFLNSQMNPAEILAVEVRQYVAKDLRTLVPRVFGQTELARTKHGAGAEAPAKQWDEHSFFRALQERSPDSVPVARRILEWITPLVARVFWGRGSRSGSFVPVFVHNGADHPLFAVWTYATVEFYFQHYITRPPFNREDLRRELMDRLNRITGVSLDATMLTKRPNIQLQLLADPQAFQAFRDAYTWFMERTTERSTGASP